MPDQNNLGRLALLEHLNGEAPGLVRKHNWLESKLGPIENWDQSLFSIVVTVITAKFPMYILWGSDRVLIYNDAYSAVLGVSKHPGSMAKPFFEVWPEVKNDLSPMLSQVEAGETVYFEDHLFNLDRENQDSEAYFTFYLSPIFNDLNSISGIVCSCFETTARVAAERSEKASKKLAAETLVIADATRAEVNNVLESMSDAFISLDKDFRMVLVNASQEKVSGRKREDEIGKIFWDVFPEAALPESKYWINYNNVMKSRVAASFVEYFEPLGLWTDVNVYPTVEGGISIFFRDITQTVTAETNVKESAAQFQTLANSIPQLAWIAKADGHIYWYNDRWYQFTGTTPKEMEGWGWQTVHDPKTLPSVLVQWMDSIKTGKRFEMIFPLKSAEGKYRQFLTLVVPMLDDDGEVSQWFGTNTDVTEQVETRKQLEKAESEARRLAAVVESGTDFIGMTDASLKPFYLNRAGREMVGFGERDLAEIEVYDFFPEEQRDKLKTEIVPQVMKNGFWEGELLLRHFKTGELIPVLYNLFPIKDPVTGETGSYASVTRNISERKKMEESLRDAKEQAERANNLKSAFLANMSHEIRTPLGAMIGFADLLGEPGVSNSDRANYIDVLHRNGEQLGRIINDILDLSKVETGQVDFEYLRVKPAQIAHEVVSLMSVVAKEKGLSLAIEDDGSAPLEIVSDPTRMTQVLMNLINNSLKFTKVGSVRISISGYQGRAETKCCAFEVTDTGAGIPEASIERLFKMFTQADNSMTRKYGGTGLGLALSRSLARAMGGDVRLVHSEPNKGSTFRFLVEDRMDLLPSVNEDIKPDHESKDLKLLLDALKNKRVLLVEDSADNQQLIWRYLSRYGATIEIADNGVEGVAKATTGEHDIILMDLQMPIMDGYTAVGKLRSGGYTKPIVALTAHAMSDVRKKCQDVGCTDHLPKPINPKDLVQSILRLTR